MTMFIGVYPIVARTARVAHSFNSDSQVTIIVTAIDGSFTDTLSGQYLYIQTKACTVQIVQRSSSATVIHHTKVIKIYPADKVIAEEL